MCVTNTTGRRHQPITFNPLQLSLFQKPPLSAAPVVSVPVAVPSFPSSVSLLDPIPVFSNNHAEKSRPKRRRKPQKPGKTAKNNDRHFVVHHYHDHANDVDHGDDVLHCEGDESSSEECHHRRRGGVAVPFPVKLHEVLDQVEADGYAHIISWQPHGRCFMIHQPKEFVDFIMPR
jgi:HSF-type DNA-binding